MNDERRTPRWLFELVNEAFHFTIDLAATRENTKCEKFFSKETDALKHTWGEEIGWCNPPYSHGNLGRFVHKAITEATCKTVMLIQGDSSTVYGQTALRYGTVLFIDRRIAFDDEPQGARFASWLVVFNGTRRDSMRLRGLDLGVVL